MDNFRVREKQIVEQAKKGFEADLFASNYNQIHSSGGHVNEILNLCRLEKGHRYLDLGTGNGDIAFRMAEQAPEVFVTGLDIVAKAVEANSQKAEREKLTHVTFVAYQGIELPFDDRAFLGVVSRFAFHHFPNPRLAAKEIARIIRCDGFCVIVFPQQLVV